MYGSTIIFFLTCFIYLQSDCLQLLNTQVNCETYKQLQGFVNVSKFLHNDACKPWIATYKVFVFFHHKLII